MGSVRGPATVAARKGSAAVSMSDIKKLRERIERLRAIMHMILDEKALSVLESLIKEAEARIAELETPDAP